MRAGLGFCKLRKSVDVNDLRYEIKCENRVKDKNTFSIKQNIAFTFQRNTYFILGDVFFFKIPKNLIASAFFFVEEDTKKHKYASAKASNAALVKTLKMIMCLTVCCFSLSVKHGQTRNVI